MREHRGGADPAASKVLVVDDDPEVARALARMLRRERFEVSTASDGAGALQLVGSFRPDVIVSDFSMPGMTGLELVRAVKSGNPSTICIILSGDVGLDEHGASQARGPDAILPKPVDRDRLCETLRATLAARA